MVIAVKCRMYLKKNQAEKALKTLGCCRYVYNLYLNTWNILFQFTGKGMSYYSCCANMTELKKVLPWLNEADSTALQSSIIPSLWTRSYFCCTIGHISEDTIRRYIEEQKHA